MMECSNFKPNRGNNYYESTKLNVPCVILEGSRDGTKSKIFYQVEENGETIDVVNWVPYNDIGETVEPGDSFRLLLEKSERFLSYESSVCTPKSTMYRAGDDFECYYGDGGNDIIKRNIWVQTQLPISSKSIECLKKGFAVLSSSRNDIQKNGVVEDIIDPELMPFPLKPRTYKEFKMSKIPEEFPDSIKRRERDWGYCDGEPRLDERASYQWIPSKVRFDSEGRARFLSEIHNLPKNKTSLPFYVSLEQVLSKMCTMFEKLEVLKRGEDSVLQIVVKAQQYHIQGGMTYSGRWHTEGLTENIKAVGVYYLRVDEGLEGGNLKFRPSTGPEAGYDITIDSEVDVKEGDAVVFSNSLPHRFRMIENTTDEEKLRSFVNFFVVDPKKPLYPTTQDISSSALALKAIKEIAKSTDQTIPLPIFYEIVHWIPGLWTSIGEARAVRQRCRDAMSKLKSGWGWIHFGNCGTVNFCSSLRLAEAELRGFDSSYLCHTESDPDRAPQIVQHLIREDVE